MNEVNQVLSYKIVPDDSRGYIEKMFDDIIHTPNRKVDTIAIFTDNAKADYAIFTGLFAENNLTVNVLQVYNNCVTINMKGYLACRAADFKNFTKNPWQFLDSKTRIKINIW